jgi:hypothetical protein
MALGTADWGCPDGWLGAVSQDSKKKKNHGFERPPSAAPVVAAAIGGRNECNERPRPQRGNSGSCPVHPNSPIVPQSVARSSNSQNALASGASRPPRTTPLLVADLARKGPTAARWPRENRTSGISHPRGS